MHFNLNPFYATEMIEKEDCILLCSDGLWGVVSEQLIQSIVLGNPPQKAADFLVQAANERGGPDNITVIIAKQTGESPITKPTIRVQRPEGGTTLVQNR
jgi:protein phosphatase